MLQRTFTPILQGRLAMISLARLHVCGGRGDHTALPFALRIEIGNGRVLRVQRCLCGTTAPSARDTRMR